MIAQEVTLAEVIGLHSGVAALCRRLDPKGVPLPEVTDMWTEFTEIEKLVGGAKLRLASRVEEAGKWKRSGARSAEEWMGKRTGTSAGAAKESLKTSKRMGDQPDTDKALRNGELSEDQANTVSDAAEANPDAERSLLGTAKEGNRKRLKEAASKAKADADTDPEATHRRQHRSRSCRRWRDREGMYNLLLRHTPEVGAELDAILDPFLRRAFDAARRQGRREAHDTYAADAVADVFRTAAATASAGTTTGRPSGDTGPDDCSSGAAPAGSPNRRSGRTEAKILGFIELSALLQGVAEPGDTCEIAGVGSVPASTLRAMLGDATLDVVIRDGVDVRTICHLGRRVTAHQRTALEARGYTCAVPACEVAHNLQIDHVTGWTLTRDTVLDDLEWLCGFHHDQKTHRGYSWRGGYGDRRWVHPDGITHPVRRHPPRAGPPPQDRPTPRSGRDNDRETSLFGPTAA